VVPTPRARAHIALDVTTALLAIGATALVCFGAGVATVASFQASARGDVERRLARVATPQPNASALAESERRARAAAEIEAARRRAGAYDERSWTAATASSSGTDESIF
jgi:hypothetical protein